MFKKTLVAGDLHCKMSLVLPQITNVATAHCCDSVVLMGDLCDDWGVEGSAMVRQLQFAVDWKAKLGALGLDVAVLIGNHDSAYLGMRRYYFTKNDVADDARVLLTEGLDIRPAISLNTFLLTHAGLTAEWASANAIPSERSAAQVAESLNRLFDDSGRMHRLSSCGPWRGGHDIPGPLWADRRELLADPYPGISQIVGHSPVETAFNSETEDGEAIWFVDTMSLRSNGLPLGDATALIVDENGVRQISLFEDWNNSVIEYCAR